MLLIVSIIEYAGHFLELPGLGSEWDVSFTFEVQDETCGIAPPCPGRSRSRSTDARMTPARMTRRNPPAAWAAKVRSWCPRRRAWMWCQKLVLDGKVIVGEVPKDPPVSGNSRLGRGEKSVISYYLVNDIDPIVSDDEAFLKVLDRFEIPFTPVAGAILMCVTNELTLPHKHLCP